MRSVLASVLIAGVMMGMIAQQEVSARAVVDETYCSLDGYPKALRQTLIVVDGRVVAPELNGVRPENRTWRRFVMQFLDPADPPMRQRVDARERVTVMIANGDGSGLTTLFSGCVPLYRLEEESKLDADTSSMDKFIGTDWRSQQKKAREKFVTSASRALVEDVATLPAVRSGKPTFRESPFVSALSRPGIVSLEHGMPRIVVFTDLAAYTFPTGDLSTIRASARADAEAAGPNLQRAEVHVFGLAGQTVDAIRHYLEAFMLVSRGYLATLASQNGSMNVSAPPRSVAMFQGTIDFPEGHHPLRLRLSTDRNGTLVGAWIEMQSARPKYVPVFGLLSCEDKQRCRYVGDNVFAQIWDDNPDPDADLKPWQPFGGMRILEFERNEDRVTGKIRDERGYIVGREKGLDFTLARVENGIF